MANSNQWKEMRKSALKTIDVTNFIELMLKQMNYQRMNGVNLIDDVDKLVNWYLWICKKYPEPEANPVSEPQPAKAEVKEVAEDSTPPAKSEEPAKLEVDDTLPSGESVEPKKSAPKKKSAKKKDK